MTEVALYKTSNDLQTKESQHFLNHCFNQVKWNPEGGDEIIEIGCGTGNITCQILKPMFPEGFNRIIATDKNKDMIEVARSGFQDAQVEFEVLDLVGELPEKWIGHFDHVFSFFCLNWIQEQK